MPDNVLISGPAGAGKTQIAIALAAESAEPTVIADFSELLAAISGARRDPVSGRFPPRDERLLPTAEYVRRALISTGVRRGLNVIATTSDGSRARRDFLLGELGPGARERVVDPGEAVVRGRLAEPEGELSEECEQAIGRWYGRL